MTGTASLQVALVVVHGWPLLPLAEPDETRQADARFMATFTRPGFFSSEARRTRAALASRELEEDLSCVSAPVVNSTDG